MRRPLSAIARSFTTRSGPPIRVGFTSDAGRGVFATRKIGIGEAIHTAEPLVAHPTLQNLTKVCYFCLKWLVHGYPSRNIARISNEAQHHVLDVSYDHDGLQQKFCCGKCADSAKAFYAIEKKGRWEAFHRFCSEESLRFPLLAKRLICMVISGMVSKDALDILSYMKPPDDASSCWMLTRTMLLDAFQGSGVPEEKLAFASAEWYSGVMARISLNSFRVELLAEDSANLLAAAVASVSGDAISGSAVYILPSMYNHDCDPNVDISWPTNSTARLSARRDIGEGEELRITYIDASMSRSSRQKLLQQAYHFVCNCARCRDEE